MNEANVMLTGVPPLSNGECMEMVMNVEDKRSIVI